MLTLIVGVAVLVGLVLLVLLYWSMLESLFPEKLGTNEVFLVNTNDLWKIRMCRYRKGRTGGQPVLLVHGANANQNSFTAPDGVNLVAFLVERGYDCWTVDLRGSRSSTPPFERNRSDVSTDDFLNDDIPTAIQFIQQETGYARIHYVGHSLGGMLLYAYALRYGTGSIASAITLGSPLGFEGDSIARRSPIGVSLVNLFPALSGAIVRGAVPIVSLFRINTSAFPTNMSNVAKTMGSGHFYRMLEDPIPGVLSDLSRWVNTPGWRMDGGDLNVLDGLKDLDLPLFAIYAAKDPFVDPKHAKDFFANLSTHDKRMLICSKENGFKHDYGHCDLVFAHEGPREIYGPIARWMETHPSRERIAVADIDIATGYQSPLKQSERADILSGDSYAHLAGDLPREVQTDASISVEPAARLKPEIKDGPKKAAAKKSTAAKKKAAAPKKAPAKKKTSATKKKTPAKSAATATKATVAPKKLAARPKNSGPNLAAASEALSALGKSPETGSQNPAPKFNVKARTAPKAAKNSADRVATPQSVLKALSNASGVLGSLKDKKE